MSFRLSKRGKIFLAVLHVGLFLLILKFGVGWLGDGRGSFLKSSNPPSSMGKRNEGGEVFQIRKVPPPISEVLKQTGPFLARMDGAPLTPQPRRRRRRARNGEFRTVAPKSSSVLNDFRLIGVWVDKSDRNFAVIESNSTKHQELVKEKGQLQGGATLVKVEPSRVILASGGEQRVLEIYFQPSFQMPPSLRLPPSRDPSRLLVMHPILSRVMFPMFGAPQLLSVLRGVSVLSSSQAEPVRAFNNRALLTGGGGHLVVIRPALFQANSSRRAALVVMRPVMARAQGRWVAIPRLRKMSVRLIRPKLTAEPAVSERYPAFAGHLPALRRGSSLVVMSPDLLGGPHNVERDYPIRNLAEQYRYSAYLE